MAAGKVNYLSNKDILVEIHRSKLSYCEFTDPAFKDYDAIIKYRQDLSPEQIETALKSNIIIVDHLDEITDEHREYARKRRCDRLNLLAQGSNRKKAKPEDLIPIESIDANDVVYRVMTYEHIPLDPTRRKNPKTTNERHTKLNFVPFKHYVYRDDKFQEVGISHWHKGEFSLIGGQLTYKLCTMFMMLIDRYAYAPNWRSYCVDEQTEALTQRGWLGIDQITEEDIIMSYSENNLVWSKIEYVHRSDYDGLMFHLTCPGMDSVITPGHKLVTTRGLVKVEELLDSDDVILMPNSTIKVSDITFEVKKYVTDEQRRHVPTLSYTGKVWCPKTDYGCFLARRKDKVFLTGQTYLDEMRGQAITQLVEVCLKFDESIGVNPFAYYTTITKTNFTKTLNTEKTVQKIRDRLLVESGGTPSFNAQIDNEIELREGDGKAPVKVKPRGWSKRKKVEPTE